MFFYIGHALAQFLPHTLPYDGIGWFLFSRGGSGEADDGRDSELLSAYRAREDKLNEFSKAIFGVATELLTALERITQEGEQVTEQFTRHIRSKLETFEEVLGHASFHSAQVHPAPLDAADPSDQGWQPEEDPSLPFLAPLGYDRIREDLETFTAQMLAHPQDSVPSARSSALILQALRWRLAHAGIRKARKRAYHAYIQGDVLGCSDPDSQLLHQLLHERHHKTKHGATVVEYTCRLINCLASHCAGRTYLLQHRQLISLLAPVLRHEKTDSIARQHALGALQKFSLRRTAQTATIAEGLVPWISSILMQHNRGFRVWGFGLWAFGVGFGVLASWVLGFWVLGCLGSWFLVASDLLRLYSCLVTVLLALFLVSLLVPCSK